MKFEPISKTYDFPQEALTKKFPNYFQDPIESWLFSIMRYSGLVIPHRLYKKYSLKTDFTNNLQLHFRQVFPTNWSEFITYVFYDSELMANFLAFCLQNFANNEHAQKLEQILSQGGSGYAVIKTDKDADEYTKGVYNLVERVSLAAKAQSEKALDDNDILLNAWMYCYSRNPDYEKVVSRSCDFLEGYLGNIYFPDDPKPQLKKFVHAFENNPSVLQYKGDTIVTPKSNLTSLLAEASNIRGQHTNGKGRVPTKQEAEFVLHTTIYIWNLHQK